MKEASVGVIFKGKKILMVSRKDNHSDFGLVGGKLEDNETPLQAFIRETKEETGVDLHNIEYLGKRFDGEYFVYVYVAHTNDEINHSENHIAKFGEWSDLFTGVFGEFNYNLYDEVFNLNEKAIKFYLDYGVSNNYTINSMLKKYTTLAVREILKYYLSLNHPDEKELFEKIDNAKTPFEEAILLSKI